MSKRLLDAVVSIPRWLDATWAIMSVIAVVAAVAFEDNVPFSASSWLSAVAWLSLSLRWYLTCFRISRGTSSLCPLIMRIGDFLNRNDS